MMKKAAESNQTRAAKHTRTRRKEGARNCAICAASSFAGAGRRVMPIPAKHNKPATEVCTSGEAVKNGGRLQTK